MLGYPLVAQGYNDSSHARDAVFSQAELPPSFWYCPRPPSAPALQKNSCSVKNVGLGLRERTRPPGAGALERFADSWVRWAGGACYVVLKVRNGHVHHQHMRSLLPARLPLHGKPVSAAANIVETSKPRASLCISRSLGRRLQDCRPGLGECCALRAQRADEWAVACSLLRNGTKADCQFKDVLIQSVSLTAAEYTRVPRPYRHAFKH